MPLKPPFIPDGFSQLPVAVSRGHAGRTERGPEGLGQRCPAARLTSQRFPPGSYRPALVGQRVTAN